jgi:hypothetical protein
MYDVAAVYSGTLSMLGTTASGKDEDEPTIEEDDR